MKIKDIAQKAGVSTATVSNVINGHYSRVSPATIAKVEKIIKEMGYRPSATARSLVSKESKIICVVVPNLNAKQAFSINAYNSQVIARLEQYVRNKGYYLMIHCIERCEEIVPILSSWNADGVIILSPFPREAEELSVLLTQPAVYMDAHAPHLPIANVGIDDYKGGFLMGRHLLAKGHRQIAVVTPPVNSPGVVQARYRGLCDALQEQGITLTDDAIFEASTNAANGVQAGLNIVLSGRRYTAVAAMSDMSALGVISGLRTCGIRVPEDISIVGFDDLDAAKYVSPPLTTIRQDIDKKCDTACDILFEMISTKKKLVVDRVLDIELIERHSVAPPANP